MRKRLIEALEGVIAAEQLAAEMRRIYGAYAEEHCDALIGERPKRDAEREHLEDVRRALRWV